MAERAAHMPLRAGVPTPANVRTAEGLRLMNVDYARVSEQIEAQQGWLRQWVGTLSGARLLMVRGAGW
jgi:hypothetical protein